jgi:hypothetical protein
MCLCIYNPEMGSKSSKNVFWVPIAALKPCCKAGSFQYNKDFDPISGLYIHSHIDCHLKYNHLVELGCDKGHYINQTLPFPSWYKLEQICLDGIFSFAFFKTQK